MLRLVSDEDVHDDFIRALRHREPALDIVRVQGVGLDHIPDPIILEWAANHGRTLLTGDLSTMVGFAWSRVQSALPTAGALTLLENVGVGRVIDDILLVARCYAEDEIKDQVWYIPF